LPREGLPAAIETEQGGQLVSAQSSQARGRFVAAVAFLLQTLSPTLIAAQEPPTPVRHDVARAGNEFLVLRHQKLVEGSHEDFEEISRRGVWPFFEGIGTRVVGQWKIVHPEGDGPTGYEEGFRLARYRSYNHWAHTRRGIELAGNGGDFDANRLALQQRGELRLDSDGPIFLEGSMAPGGPYYHPGLDETYELVGSETELDPDSPKPVRRGAAVNSEQELLTLRRFRIVKGTFEEFNRLSREGVWPYFEKMGARIVGQWKVVHPELPVGAGQIGQTTESTDYDEAYMLVRYASHPHWKATRPSVMDALGGNGPDYDLCRESLRRRAELTLETSVRFLAGELYNSPPVYLPALEERYLLVD
jgi:hypothetical protein